MAVLPLLPLNKRRAWQRFFLLFPSRLADSFSIVDLAPLSSIFSSPSPLLLCQPHNNTHCRSTAHTEAWDSKRPLSCRLHPVAPFVVVVVAVEVDEGGEVSERHPRGQHREQQRPGNLMCLPAMRVHTLNSDSTMWRRKMESMRSLGSTSSKSAPRN